MTIKNISARLLKKNGFRRMKGENRLKKEKELIKLREKSAVK